jgi:signal transduction histidine kinase/CheY-like chemotaxis protein
MGVQPIVSEKIRITLRFITYTLASGFIGSVLVTIIALQGKHPNLRVICAWFALSSLNFTARYVFVKEAKRLPPERLAALSGAAWKQTLLSGAVWGVSALAFIPTLSHGYQVAFVIVLLGLNVTSVPLMSDVRGMSVLFFPAWGATALAFILAGEQVVIPLAIAFMLGCVFFAAYVIRNTLDEYIRLRIERDKALAELQETSAMQMSFFLAAGHDFRQPLTAIGYLTAALQRALSGQGKDIDSLCKHLGTTTTSLEHLIDDTISSAQVSMGFKAPELRVVDAKEVAATLTATFGQQASDKGLSFRVRVDERCQLMTDPNVLRRILDNLLVNAIRHTKEGGVLVAFRCVHGLGRIEVWDTGAGIPAGEQMRVFDQGYQSRRKTSNGRYGLGLMIVRKLVARVGATVQLRSREDKGSAFRIEMPIAVNCLRVRPSIPVRTAGDVDLKGFKIAVVDDDDMVRESLALVLRSAGAEVISAADSKGIVARAADAAELDLLVTDFHLVGELGTAVIDAVRRKFPDCARIVFTGDEPADVELLLDDREASVLPKSLPPADFLDIVNDTLQSRAAALSSA